MVRGALAKSFAGLAFLVAVIGAALFVTAGTVDYWQGWVFLGVFTAAVTAITIDLAIHDPALLARRTKAGPVAETRRWQQVMQSIASVAFIAVFVVSALDHRLGWSHVPFAVEIAGDVLVALGLGGVALVFRANTFTAATIEVEQDQSLVTTGPYGVVRHPMYSCALAMMIGVPLALGSWWGLVAVVPLVAAIVMRLLDEEALLREQLPAYADYRTNVRYRLIPFVF